MSLTAGRGSRPGYESAPAQTDVAYLLLLQTGDLFAQIGMEEVHHLVTPEVANIVKIKKKLEHSLLNEIFWDVNFEISLTN